MYVCGLYRMTLNLISTLTCRLHDVHWLLVFLHLNIKGMARTYFQSRKGYKRCAAAVHPGRGRTFLKSTTARAGYSQHSPVLGRITLDRSHSPLLPCKQPAPLFCVRKLAWWRDELRRRVMCSELGSERGQEARGRGGKENVWANNNSGGVIPLSIVMWLYSTRCNRGTCLWLWCIRTIATYKPMIQSTVTNG